MCVIEEGSGLGAENDRVTDDGAKKKTGPQFISWVPLNLAKLKTRAGSAPKDRSATIHREQVAEIHHASVL